MTMIMIIIIVIIVVLITIVILCAVLFQTKILDTFKNLPHEFTNKSLQRVDANISGTAYWMCLNAATPAWRYSHQWH